jgi:transcriptional regulator with XRE-family HTH domain
MSSVGERLKHEREARNTTIEQIAEATGIGLSYLEAMERNELDTLPGRAFGKLYVRAYAAVLEFDPQPLIDAYDRAQRMEINAGTAVPRTDASAPRPVAAAIARWKEGRQPETTPVEDEPEPQQPAEIEQAPVPIPTPEPEPEPVPEPEPEPVNAPVAIAEPDPPRVATVAPSRTRAITRIALAVVALTLLAYFISRRSDPGTPPPVREAAPAEPAPAPAAPPLDSAPPAATPEPKPAAPPPARQQARPPIRPGTLSVTESGLGRRVVNSRLEGEGDRFEVGTVVYFQTRVQGGVRGQAFRHVWIHEGRAQQSIPLRLGDADWRTYSTKTLYKAGAWTVEARDSEGRVLASAAFTCEPRGGR